jgi:hypothetical protein
MTDKPEMGKTHWNQEVARIRAATSAMRKDLMRIVRDRPGQAQTANLISRAALRIGDIDEAILYLEEIAGNSKARIRNQKETIQRLKNAIKEQQHA